MTLRGILAHSASGAGESGDHTAAGQDFRPDRIPASCCTGHRRCAHRVRVCQPQFRSSFDYTLGASSRPRRGRWLVRQRPHRHVAEDPNTLQEAFVATNSGRMESFSFVSPMAYTLDYLMLWTTVEDDHLRIASGLGVIAGSAAYALRQNFRWKVFAMPRHRQPHRRRSIDGFGHLRARLQIGQGISASRPSARLVITFC